MNLVKDMDRTLCWVLWSCFSSTCNPIIFLNASHQISLLQIIPSFNMITIKTFIEKCYSPFHLLGINSLIFFFSPFSWSHIQSIIPPPPSLTLLNIRCYSLSLCPSSSYTNSSHNIIIQCKCLHQSNMYYQYHFCFSYWHKYN